MTAVLSVVEPDLRPIPDPYERFRVLLSGSGFPAGLAAEPIVFDRTDPVFGFACQVPGCRQHSTQAGLWCTAHAKQRWAAGRSGQSEREWVAAAEPLPAKGEEWMVSRRRRPCRFCPDRDEQVDGLCGRHDTLMRFARGRARAPFDRGAWNAAQHDLGGAGDCVVRGCLGRAERDPGLCPTHRQAWQRAGQFNGSSFDRWVERIGQGSTMGVVALAGLPPLLEAELRYGLWVHAQDTGSARWHPMWLRTLVASCARSGVGSVMDLDPTDRSWTPQPAAVNRIVLRMQAAARPVHVHRDETRALGYIDPTYWGFKFPARASVFDLSRITQPWLRELTWDFFAALLDDPKRPRTAGTVEAHRRAMVVFSAFLEERSPDHGAAPAGLGAAIVREFVADLEDRTRRGAPMLGITRVDGAPTAASPTTRSLTLNALRRVMRWALDTGRADDLGLPRSAVVAFPPGNTQAARNPRPFADPVLRALSDPANVSLLRERDPRDNGVADIWTIQVKCGRRIGEVVGLRFDCVSEHQAMTWLWVDMTKVGLFDYAIQIPRDVYDLIRTRQAKTAARYRKVHGVELTIEQARRIALFPSRVRNPTWERSMSTATFNVAFKAWIESPEINLPGHTSHQARHTLATRLVHAGASMTHVKQVLGHVSERMSESYVRIAGTQIEPFLQQLWVTGPGHADPGLAVLTPTEAETTSARQLMIDLSVVPTEHGLCTFKPVVGGSDCPYDRQCHSCEHFVVTGADYAYWKRQEQRWATLAEGAPDESTRTYLYEQFEPTAQTILGLEKALTSAGLLDQARQVDLRNPYQDFFDPIWTHGWRASDLIALGADEPDTAENPTPTGDRPDA